MIRPRIMPNAVIHQVVWVSRALGAELPDGPVFAMLGVEEGDEVVERVAVSALRVGLRGPRGGDEEGRDVGEIEVCFGVPGAGARDDLAEDGSHGLDGSTIACVRGKT